ncbi:MAG: NADH-quinone oxidoreductase subunit J [Thermoplasmata archaeon]|nr:NADH-quinone oxidoreductase subunit J [Thermoplasmata archaeon]
MSWIEVVFWFIAIITLLSVIAMIRAKEITHSVVYIATAFLGIAAMFVLLNAEFLAIVQILVYVGAIVVLILFAIMLTKRELPGGRKE